jgi:excisionase family DNA binding protein
VPDRGEIGMIASTAERPSDKLTIAEICADLGISRRTFYEWRAKKRAPKCIRLPNGDLRIRRSEYQRWLEAREEIT